MARTGGGRVDKEKNKQLTKEKRRKKKMEERGREGRDRPIEG